MEFSTELLKTFLAIIDTGGFTSAGQVVHKTQSAISMQVRRLEEAVGQNVFERTGRSIILTPIGENLVPYARRMVKFHEEMVAAIAQPDLVGSVRIGTPDDYALRFLPNILSNFSRVYPRVQITVRCDPTSHLVPALEKGEIDLALLTREASQANADIVRTNATVWVTSSNHLAHEESPLPLAVFQGECIFRNWTLDTLNKEDRKYRVAFQSPSITGILAAVSAGLAVTVLSACVVPPELRILNIQDGFPKLPDTSIVLQASPSTRNELIENMAKFIREGFKA